MTRRLAFVFASLLSFATWAAGPIVAGKDYFVIDTPLAATPGKVDVVEFFSYGCPHCRDFNPLVKQWEGKAGGDIAFRKVPVSFGRPAWARLAGIYYAMEATGDLAKLDDAAFTAVHGERNTFPTEASVADWAASKGADRQKLLDALTGFSMPNLIRRGDADATQAKIRGVPAIVVGGKYLINNESTQTYNDIIRVLNELVAKVRQESAGKK